MSKQNWLNNKNKVRLKITLFFDPQGGAGQAGPGPDMGGASQGGNEAGYGDDVVDADYKEV